MRRRIHMISLVFLVGIAAAVVLSPYAAQACSVCGGSAIGTDPGTGFNTSILFLLSMPFVVVGAVAGVLIYWHRRASADRQKEGARVRLVPEQSGREMA